MQIDNMLLEMQFRTEDANSVKEIVLGRLLKDNIINEEQARIYSEKWQITIIKKSWFKRWAEKFSNNDKESYLYKFVRFED